MYDSFSKFIENKFRIDAHFFIRGSLWITVNQVFVAVSGVAVSALFAHYLSPNNYGIYRYLVGLALLLATFSLTGLPQAILQATARGYNRFYTDTIKLNLFYSSGIFLISLTGFGYYLIKDNLILAIGCLLIALLQPVITTFQNISVFLQASGRFRESTLVQVCKTLFASFVGIVAIFLTQNVLVLLVTYLLAHAFSSVISHFLFFPKKHRSEFQPALHQKFLSYAKHSSLQNLVSGVAYRMDTIMVFTLLGATELAIYTIATVIPEQIKGTFKTVSSLLLQKYSKTSSHTVIRKGLQKRSFQFFGALFLVTIGYITMSPFFFGFFFPKYHEAVIYSQIFSLAFLTYVYLIPLTLLQSTTDKKTLYQFHTIPSIIQIILTPLLIFVYGLWGAVASKIIIQTIRLFYAYWLTSRKEF